MARSSALNLLGSGVSALSGLLLVVLIARVLPQAEAGIFFSVTALFLIVGTVAGLGTGTGLVYFTARMRVTGDVDRIGSYRRAAIVPVLGLSVVGAAAFVLLAPSIAQLVGGTTTDVRAAVIVLGLVLPVTALSDYLVAATQGYATMAPTVAAERVGRPVLQIGLVSLTAAAGGSIGLITAAWALPWLGSALLAWRLLASVEHRPAAEPATSSGTPYREFWSFTWPRAVTGVAQLLLQRLDVVIITALLGPAPAAVYVAASRFLVVGQLGSTAIGTAAQPQLAGLLAVGDLPSARTVYQASTAWVVLIVWPLYLTCAVFGDVVLALFGGGYAGGRPVIAILAAAMLFASACGTVSVVLNMAGRTRWTLVNSVIAVVVMLALDLVLIPTEGIVGAAIGWAAGIVTINALPLAQLFVGYRLHPFGRATLMAAGLSLVGFGAIPALARLALPGGPAAVTALAVGTALYGAACAGWRGPLGLANLLTARRS